MRKTASRRISRVLIEPSRRGTVRLWINEDCLVVESGTQEWAALWATAGVESPSDLDAGADLGEAVRQLVGTIVDVGAVAA